MKIDQRKHFDEATLERYAMGDLSGRYLDAVEEHLLLCERCRSRVVSMDLWTETFSAAITEFNEQNRDTEPARGDSRFHRLWPSFRPLWAGVAVAAIALSFVIPNYSQPGSARNTEVRLNTSRGAEMLKAGGPSGRLTLLIDTIDLPESKSYGVKVVDHTGDQVWAGIVTPAGREIKVPVPVPFSRGTYWVRLYNSDNGALLRESGILVK